MTHTNHSSQEIEVPYDPEFDSSLLRKSGSDVIIQIRPWILFLFGFLFGSLVMAIPTVYFFTRLFL